MTRAASGEVMKEVLAALDGGPADTVQISAILRTRGMDRARPQVLDTCRNLERKGLVTGSEEVRLGRRMMVWTKTGKNLQPMRRRLPTEILGILADGPATSREMAASITARRGTRCYAGDVTAACIKLERKGVITHEEVQCRHAGNHPPYRWMLCGAGESR